MKWLWLVINPRKYAVGGGGGGAPATPPPPEFVLSSKYKTSAPDLFSSCLFIPRAHFETSLVMGSFYG